VCSLWGDGSNPLPIVLVDDVADALVQAIDDRPTHLCVSAERRLLEALGGSCRSPIAALATAEESAILLRAEILTNDGSEYEAGQISFAPDNHDAPLALASHLLSRASPAREG